MDQFSDRRYRLNGDEVPPVMQLVRERLAELLEERVDHSEAEVLYKVLYRFETYQQGRPTYPELITWDTIAALLNNGTISQGEEDPGPKGVGGDLPGESVKESFTKGGHP